MSDHEQPESEDPQFRRLRELASTTQARLDMNFADKVEELMRSITALDIALHGVELDRATYPASSEDDLRARWAVHIGMLSSLATTINIVSNDLRSRTRAILALD